MNLLNIPEEKGEENELKERVTTLEATLVRVISHMDQLLSSVSEMQERFTDDQCHNARKGMTNAEYALTFYYLFESLGVHFGNSDKTEWARFLSRMTGKSEHCIRQELNFTFESKKTNKILNKLVAHFEKLLPGISEQIKNDIKEV